MEHLSDFEQVVKEHQARVFSLAWRMLQDRSRAEEIAQEVFLSLYRNAGRIESEAHLRHWLRQVTTRRCVDELRNRRRSRESTAGSDFFETAGAGLAPPQGDHLLSNQLRDLVGCLPASPRMVMVLRYQEGLGPTEIAQTLRLPVNTVKSHLKRSIKWLRSQLSGTAEVTS